MTEDKPEQGRTRCQDRNMCARGCSFGAYFSTQAVTLPAARKTGNLTLMSDQVVTNLEYDPATKRVTGVRVVDANTKLAHVYRSRIVFLCASAMASTQILLNSRLPGRSGASPIPAACWATTLWIIAFARQLLGNGARSGA